MNNVLQVEYPNSLAFSLKESKEHLEKEMKLMLSLKLYELGKVSSGTAAKIAGISRKEFLLCCGNYNVSIFSDLNDIKSEIENV
jgi:predicted HTH domain antitoxin